MVADRQVDPLDSSEILFGPSSAIHWVESLLTVPSEAGQIIPFTATIQQRQMDAEHTGRDITVKARQTKASSWIQARNVRRMTTGFGLNCVVITQTDQMTQLFRARVKHHLEDLRRHGLDFEVTIDNRNELVLGKMENRWIFSSGEAKSGGVRGVQTAHIVHACLARGTLVVGEDGFVEPIENFTPGKVITHLGHRVDGLGSTSSGMKDMVQVVLAGEKVTCTPDHLFWTEEGWVAARDLAGKYVGVPIRRVGGCGKLRSWRIVPGRENKQLLTSFPLNEDTGRVVGLFLAEGSLFRAGVTFSLHRKERAIAEWLVEILTPYIHSSRITEPGGERLVLAVYSTALRRMFDERLYRRGDKAIPDALLRAPRSFLKGLVRGYIDGDGSIADPQRITVTSTRPQLLTQLRDIVLGLHHWWGPIYRSRTWRYEKPTQDKYDLVFQGAANDRMRRAFGWPAVPQVRSVRAHTHKGKRGDHHWVKVQAVLPADRAEAFDLIVDAVDHSFRTLSSSTHNSEVAHWETDPGNVLGGLIPAIPPPPHGWFDIESTPNGADGFFYEYVQDAQEDEAIYRAHFYPWWIEPAYTIESYRGATNIDVDGMISQFKPTREEELLMERHALRPDQILWRRIKTKELLRTGQFFAQEYPEDLQKCFLTAGGAFFNDPTAEVSHLEWYADQIAAPMLTYNDLPYQQSIVSFYGPHFRVWEPPIPGHVYAMFMDCAAGFSNNASEDDFTAMPVIDVETFHHVATLRLKAAPEQCGQMACAIGQFYNHALFAVERNGYGAGALNKAKELNYPNIYYYLDPDQPDAKPQAGWYTSEKTRDMMLTKLRIAIFNRSLTTRDAAFVREAGAFTWQKIKQRGDRMWRAEARSGKDDMVIAMAGCLAIRERVLPKTGYEERAVQIEQARTGEMARSSTLPAGGSVRGALPWMR